MRRVRASSGRRVAAAVAVDVTAVADTVVAGVTVAVAASEEAAATSQLALPSDRVLENPLSQRICACRRFDSLPLRIAHAIAQLGKCGQGWIRTSEGVKPADLQSAPFGHFGTYPFWREGFHISSRLTACNCPLAFAAVDSTNVTVTF